MPSTCVPTYDRIRFVDTGATCGPYGDAWVSAEATGPGVRVCVTTNTGHILC